MTATGTQPKLKRMPLPDQTTSQQAFNTPGRPGPRQLALPLTLPSAPPRVSGLTRYMATPASRRSDITSTLEATTHVRVPAVTKPLEPQNLDPEFQPEKIGFLSLRWALSDGRLRAAQHRQSVLSVLAACLIVGLFGIAAQASRVRVAQSHQAIQAQSYHELDLEQPSDREKSLPKAVPTATPLPLKPTPPAAPPPVYSGPAVDTVGQPCHSTNLWVAGIGNWATPPDCYATIYYPNPANYPPTPGGWGYCNWWVNELNPTKMDLLYSSAYRRGSTPVPGAAIYFAGYVQGAGSAGHFAQVVAIAPDHYWMLITEMNFAWRGGGFGRVDYRYAHVGSGVTFIYP